MPHAERSDQVQLRQEGGVLGGVAVHHGAAGADGVVEGHARRRGGVDQLAEACQLVGRVGLPPALPVIGVVFRRVVVVRQTRASHEAQDVEAIVVRPGRAVEALDDADPREGRIGCDVALGAPHRDGGREHAGARPHGRLPVHVHVG